MLNINPLRQPSITPHQFSKVPILDSPRSVFNRSSGYTTTINTDYLYPIFLDEMLPGDTINLNLNIVGRLNTPLTPVMDNLTMDVFFFSCANRLLWENWTKLCGERINPADSVDFTVPQIDAGGSGFAEESLADYFGLPVGVADLEVNALPFRMYNLVWNQFFRHQDLQDSVTVDLDDGTDDITDYVLLKRNKRHDYFTACLPNPLKGGSSIDLPLGSSAPVIGTKSLGLTNGYENFGLRTYSGTMYGDTGGDNISYGAAISGVPNNPSNDNVGIGVSTSAAVSGLIADLSSATAATINSFRESIMLQRMLELESRAGTRFNEIIQAHFGVYHPDAQWRPEYLGGGSRPIIIDPIANTSSTTDNVGMLGAHGFVNAQNIHVSKSFTEHSYVMGLVNVRADLRYQSGLHKLWTRETKYDFYWPELAHLGEQPVYSREIYCDGTSGDDDVFGYQEAWSDYRYKPSIITSQMRSSHSLSLDVWHLAQDFSSRPVLNSSFMQEAVPISRVSSVETEPTLKLDIWTKLIHARPMPVNSIPGNSGRF